MRALSYGILATVAAVVVACGDGDDNALIGLRDGGPQGDAPGAAEPFRATVRRTTGGIPHVRADDLGGAGYGYGYAFAEDNLCILAEEILTVRGERAKYFGDVAYDLGNSSSKSNVASDAVFRMLATKEVADRSRASLDAEMQAAVRGFAAGVSRYVRELRAGKHEGRHASCRAEPWVREIGDEDLYLRYYKLALLGSSATFIDGIFAARPLAAFIGPPVAPRPITSAAIQAGLDRVAPGLLAQRRGDLGSNMYAFGSATTGGPGIQFGNPHFPWYGGERLYQVHLTVPGKVDVQGASLYGVPFVLIGFNDKVAWSHTVSTAYRFTPYGLTLKPGDPFTYLKDGQEKKITPVDLEIEVKVDGAAPRKEAVRLYRSEYGPMLYLGSSFFDWTTEKAFTIRDANAENFRLLRGYARWNQARSLDELERIQVEEVSTPWVNTTAADTNGDVYYGDVTVVPNVPNELATACEIPLLSRALANAAPGLPLLDGSKQACDWKIDADGPQSGAFGASHLPRVRRKDYVVNCNDSYWLTNPTAPITGFARIIGREGYEQSLRSRLCHQQVLDRLAGTDGNPGTAVDAEILKKVVLSSRVYSAEKSRAAVLAALCPPTPPTITLSFDALTKTDVIPPVVVDVAAACTALAAWDGKNDPTSKGSLVWDELWFRVEALRATVAVYKIPFDAADPIQTPRDLDLTRPELAQAFAAAVRSIQASGFPVDAPRSAFSFRLGRGGAADRIPVPGGFQRTGSFTVAQKKGSVLRPDVGYGPLDQGNSYLQIVTLSPAKVEASTCLTYGLSSDPASPRYDELTRMYGEKKWLPAWMTEAEVAADTKETLDLSQ